jgi:hypothetical protein
MENEQGVQNINVIKKNNFIKPLLILGLFLLGLLLGFIMSNMLQPAKEIPQGAGTVMEIPPVINEDPRLLLDPIEQLKTPVFTEWGGSVEGIVVAKDSESFTIEKSGRQLKVYLQQSLTGFYTEPISPDQLPQQITYEQINIGDTVRGAVTISRETLDNNPEHHIFANVFTVIQNENQISQ